MSDTTRCERVSGHVCVCVCATQRMHIAQLAHRRPSVIEPAMLSICVNEKEETKNIKYKMNRERKKKIWSNQIYVLDSVCARPMSELCAYTHTCVCARCALARCLCAHTAYLSNERWCFYKNFHILFCFCFSILKQNCICTRQTTDHRWMHGQHIGLSLFDLYCASTTKIRFFGDDHFFGRRWCARKYINPISLPGPLGTWVYSEARFEFSNDFIW